MIKKYFILICFFLFFIFAQETLASNSPTFVTIINPVRGQEGWRFPKQSPLDIPIQLYEVASQSGLPSTWLLRYDAVNDATISGYFKSIIRPDILVSVGGLLEITPDLTKKINISYPSGETNGTVLSGYTQDQRLLLIDTFMDSFKNQFGFFPRIVGAWHIDSFSLSYLEEKYSIQAAMILDDQYQTDDISLLGGYLGSPYFPDKNNSLIPAQDNASRINIPIVRYAQRDLFNVINPQKISLFSIQPNDYQRLGLTTSYFENLFLLYTQKGLNKFTYINIGLENDLFETDFIPELKNIFAFLKQNKEKYNLIFYSLENFGNWMKSLYPESSPVYFYRTQDPAKLTSGEVVWYQTPFYRLGLKSSGGYTKIIDLRVYNRQIYEDYYTTANQNSGILAEIPAEIDAVKSTSPAVILNADLEKFTTTYDEDSDIWKISLTDGSQQITFTPQSITFTNIEVPQTNFKNINETKSGNIVLWTTAPHTPFTDRLNYSPLFWIVAGVVILFATKKIYRHKISKNTIPLVIGLLCMAITSLSVVKSGMIFPYGIGFWGPNGHDAVFHLSIIEKFARNPFDLNHPQLAGENLTNYHFVFDYLSGIIVNLFNIPSLTFYFRITPIILGLTIVFLLQKLMTKWGYANLEKILGYILVFLAGSFGFIPRLLTNQNIFSGESAFWANQSASLFLNPPFVLSLIFLILFLINLPSEGNIKPSQFVKLVLFGSILAQTKVYAFILLIIALFLSRQIKLVFAIGITGVLITLPFSSLSGSPFIFDPLWFTRSLFASLDRFFIPNLVQAWQVYEATGNIPKLMAVNLFAIIVFVLGNLGIRSISLPILFKKDHADLSQNIIRWLIIAGLILPLIIVQKFNPWNTIQFMYYSLFFLGLITAKVLSNIISYTKQTTLKIILLIIILPLSIATSIGTLKDYSGSISASRIGFTELRALDTLKELPKGLVLSPFYSYTASFPVLNPKPLFAYTSTAYISALSGHPEFLSDTINLDITGLNYQGRAKDVQRFFNTSDTVWAKGFLVQNNIKYIYETPLKKMKLSPESLSLTKVFESGEINIYQTN